MSNLASVAQRVVEYDPQEMSSEVRAKLCACLLFNLSVGLAGWRADDAVHHAFLSTHTAPGDARVLVGSHSLAPADAAFINAGLITARSQNDTHTGINGHLGCVVVPAVLALATEGRATVAELMSALAVGYEVPLMIAQHTAGEVGKRGFRGTSVFAVFGAAAAGARLLGLDVAQTAHALAIASNFSGGLMQCWEEGTMEWRVQVAHASRSGVVAALLALHGVQGAAYALEGKNGFYRAFAGAIPPFALPNAFNEVLAVSFKPYPGCTINQPPLHALLRIVTENALDSADIERVTVRMNPAQAHYPGVNAYGPFASDAGAIMSAPFMLELALEQGFLKRADFALRYGADPLHARSARVRIDEDASLAAYTSFVTVRTRDGREWTARGSNHDLAFGWDRVVDLARSLMLEWSHPAREQQLSAILAAVELLRSGPWEADAFVPLEKAIWMQSHGPLPGRNFPEPTMR